MINLLLLLYHPFCWVSFFQCLLNWIALIHITNSCQGRLKRSPPTQLSRTHRRKLRQVDMGSRWLRTVQYTVSEREVIDIGIHIDDLNPGMLLNPVQISGNTTQPGENGLWLEHSDNPVQTRIQEGYVGDRLLGWRVRFWGGR